MRGARDDNGEDEDGKDNEEEEEEEEEEGEMKARDYFWVAEGQEEEEEGEGEKMGAENLSLEEFASIVQSPKWTRHALDSLVKLVNSLTYGPVENISPSALLRGAHSLSSSVFRDFSSDELTARFALHLLFARVLSATLPLIYLHSAKKYPHSLAALLSSIRSLIFKVCVCVNLYIFCVSFCFLFLRLFFFILHSRAPSR